MSRSVFEGHEGVREVVPVDDELGAPEPRGEAAHGERRYARWGLEQDEIRLLQSHRHRERQLTDLQQHAHRHGEQARQETLQPRGRGCDETQRDVRMVQHLGARRGSLVCHDVNIHVRLRRQRQCVILHARGTAEIAQYDNLRAATAWLDVIPIAAVRCSSSRRGARHDRPRAPMRCELPD